MDHRQPDQSSTPVLTHTTSLAHPPSALPRRVALLNLRYSPNLGDVLLCECLEYGLRQTDPNIDIIQLDITGRRDFMPGSTRRLAMLAIMQRLPQPMRHAIARIMLGRSLRKTKPYWHAELANVHAAVLGGGHLLADADLNFPLKVAAIFNAVAAAKIPAAVYAVGVSNNWSQAGARLFRTAFTNANLAYAAVRDESSRAVWSRNLGPSGIAPPVIARDPGLLAAPCFGPQPRTTHNGIRIGLCLSHPVALRYHADSPMPPGEIMTAWFATLIQGFAKKGYSVDLFATGSPEDEAYLNEVSPQLLAAANPNTTVTRIPHLNSATALAHLISTFDLVIAHRLHACIAAYSYGVPNIGLTWDSKMQSFFDSVSRARYLHPAVITPVEQLLVVVDEALKTGINTIERDAIIAETRRDIALLLTRIFPPPT